MKSWLVIALAVLGTAGAWAQNTPVGLWKTIDDETKTEKSLVRLTESGSGVLTGRIEKIFDPAKVNDKCVKCTDERKDQPLVGLTIVRRVSPAKDDPGVWDGGDITDPNNGKTYRVRMTPIEGGKKLEVRGYFGTPLIGRTQTWIRVE
jgi:uncharacterized protein (DUF2147 family)